MIMHSRFLIRASLIVLVAALVAPALSCADRQEAGEKASPTGAPSDAPAPIMSVSDIPTIEPAELAARLASEEPAPLVLDVRTQAEFDEGHIPGALHIPYDELPNRLAEVDTTNGVAVHCRVGPRARKAEATLVSAGVENILHLEGGYQAWMQAGLETTK